MSLASIQQIAQQFSGTIGVAAAVLDGSAAGAEDGLQPRRATGTVVEGEPGTDNRRFTLRDRERFATASVIKLPILVTAFRMAEAGALTLHDRVELTDDEQVSGSGVFHLLEPGLRPTVLDVLTLMIIVSDNTATNLAIDQVGKGRVNETMAEVGCGDTYLVGKLQLPPEKRNEEQRRGVSSTTTPHDMLHLLTELYRGRLAGEESTRAMLDILKEQQHLEMIARYLPIDEEDDESIPEVKTGTKSGSIRGVRNDVGIVWTPRGTYAVALMSKGCEDRRYHLQNEATLALAQISKHLYDAWG